MDTQTMEKEDYARMIQKPHVRESVAEYLYGHPRSKAVEWAKEDKFDSCADQAEEILCIVARAILAPWQRIPR